MIVTSCTCTLAEKIKFQRDCFIAKMEAYEIWIVRSHVEPRRIQHAVGGNEGFQQCSAMLRPFVLEFRCWIGMLGRTGFHPEM